MIIRVCKGCGDKEELMPFFNSLHKNGKNKSITHCIKCSRKFDYNNALVTITGAGRLNNLKNRKPKGKICIDCGGTGKIINRIKTINQITTELKITETKIACTTCNGRGWVKNYGKS